jgi:signal transduction histidine kinase
MKRSLSIRTRLTLVIFTGVLISLVAAVAVTAGYELRSLRHEFLAGGRLLGRMVSEYAAVDMAFEDREEAATTLGKLENRDDIRYAALYTIDGVQFASYGQPLLRATAGPLSPLPTLAIDGDLLRVYYPVVHAGTRFGTLDLGLSTAGLRARTRARVLSTVVVALAIAGLALVLAVWLQRLISRPILDLTATVRKIAEEGNYTVRASAPRADEIGELADGFNSMMEEVARQRDQADHAIRARDEFLSVASHELNTPLTSLKLGLQSLALESDGLDARRMRFLTIATKQAERLERLVAELLDVTRLRRGTMQLALAPTDLVELATDIGTRLAPDLERSKSRLEVEHEGAVVGEWDRSRLDQVITNLLFNAIKFGEGKPIVVAISAAAGRARVVVRDHGRGIPPERIARVFEAYERGVSSAHYGGLGLGLFIVRSVVERHGGTVRAENMPDGGAAFTVELPLSLPSR